MKRHALIDNELVRFGVIGIVNTAFSYVVYAALIFVGCNYALAYLLAVILGILFSFKTQGTLVFKNTANRRLLRFVFAWSLIYLCNILLISTLNRFGFSAYVSGALAIPFYTVLSYFAQKFFVFRAAKSSA